MDKFLIEGKRDVSLFEFWGGLGSHYHALSSLGYIIFPEKHYFYYKDDFNIDAYAAINNIRAVPHHLISSKVSLKNISLARYDSDNILIWKHMDIVAIGNCRDFYKDNNHLEIARIIEECNTKFVLFESKYFEQDETKKVTILKEFLKKLSSIGYIIKEITMNNYEYFSLLKQDRPYIVCYLPNFIFFKQDYLDKKTERYYFMGQKQNWKNTGTVPFFTVDRDYTCRLRIYKQKPYIDFNIVKENKDYFTYNPLDKYELPIIFRPKGLHSHRVNKVDKYIDEVKKWYDNKEKKFKYTRPKIGYYSNIWNRKWLTVTQLPLRELLLQYGFFSEAAYVQELGRYRKINKYIQDEENEWKIIKSLADTPSINVLKYIYGSVFIYIKRNEVRYAKEYRN